MGSRLQGVYAPNDLLKQSVRLFEGKANGTGKSLLLCLY